MKQFLMNRYLIPSIAVLALTSTMDCKIRQQIVQPEMENGSMDLTGYQFFHNSLPLKGDWNFYWNEFKTEFGEVGAKDGQIPPSLLGEKTESPQSGILAKIPSHWSELQNEKENSHIKTQGTATFHAKVILDQQEDELGIRVPPMDTAFTLYWNGKEIARNGNIYKEKGDIFPVYYAPLIIRLSNVKEGANDIYIHMANSIYPRPGFRDPLVLGKYSEMYSSNQQDIFIDIFLLGSLFIISIYHFGLWLLRREDISTLYFSLLSLFMFVRISVTGEAIAFEFLPIDWKTSTFLEYISFYLSVGMLLLFVKSLYEKNSIKIIDRILIILVGIFSLVVLLFPLPIYSETLIFFQLVTVAGGIYVFFIIGSAIRDKRESSLGFLLAMLVFITTFVNDALYSLRVIESVYLISLGIFTFFFAQAFLLSQRFANAFNTAAILTRELDKKVQERTRDLKLEKERSDNLLKNILPDEIAMELKEKGTVKPMYYPSVTVMFVDFVDFTSFSETMYPNDLVRELDVCFRAFDEIIEKNGLEKLKTIGDSYMCVSGLPLQNPNHAVQCCEAALEIRSWMENYQSRRTREGRSAWSFRLGIHSGSVTAGVIGSKKFAFDIWGDTVNVASRMESHGEEGVINLSSATYQLIKDRMVCESRGELSVKGKGKLKMYQLIK